MKFIIFSFLMMFLSVSAHALMVEKVPEDCAKNALLPHCPTVAPANTLSKVFEKEYDLHLEREEDQKFTFLKMPGREIHLKWEKNDDRSLKDKVIGKNKYKNYKIHNGKNKKDPCYYEYKIGMNSTNSRIVCSADLTPEKALKCKTASDPLLQKKAMCQEFVDAMISCSQADAFATCQSTFYMRAVNHDRLLGDVEFRGEPDDPSKYRDGVNAGAGGR